MIEDRVSDSRLSLVCIDIAEKWKAMREDFWDQHELQMRVTQGFRTYQDQWAIYAQGRKKSASGEWIVFDKKKIVSHARGGESFHNFGLAVDIAFMGDDPYLDRLSKDEQEFLWNEYGRLCHRHDLEWGGDWKSPDRPHCEKTYGLSLSELQMIFEASGIKGIYGKCSQIMACGKEIL